MTAEPPPEKPPRYPLLPPNARTMIFTPRSQWEDGIEVHVIYDPETGRAIRAATHRPPE
jgi:hypothetical protein